MRHNRTKFVVFERNGKDLDNLIIPDLLRKLCRKAEGFVGSNLSSTQIRQETIREKLAGRILCPSCRVQPCNCF